jgi:hypothetical protein
MVDLQRRNNLQFDAILGAEIASDYKPMAITATNGATATQIHDGNC